MACLFEANHSIVAIIIFSLLAIELLVRFHRDKPLRGHLEGESSTEYLVVSTEGAKTKPFESIYKSSLGRWRQLDRNLLTMIGGIAIVIFLIFVRSIYRTVELSDGW